MTFNHSPAPPPTQGSVRLRPQDLESVPCLVCGSAEHEPFMHADEYRYGMGGRFHIVRCKQCGHLYTSPRPKLELIGQYYPDDYYEGLLSGKLRGTDGVTTRGLTLRERALRVALREHFGYPGQRNPLAWLLTLPVAWRLRRSRRHVDALPWAGEGTLLDLGCGACGFLLKQRARGWRTQGMDFNPAVAQGAKRCFDLDVAIGSWPGDTLRDRRFDAITLWHVIEHLPDPVGCIRQAVSQLNPGGFLLICCPNVDSWAFRHFGEFWTGLDVPRHFSFFSRTQMARLLQEVGLTVTTIRPQVRPTPLRISAAQQAKVTGSKWQAFVAKRRFWWRMIAFWTGLTNACDGMVIIAHKPK